MWSTSTQFLTIVGWSLIYFLCTQKEHLRNKLGTSSNHGAPGEWAQREMASLQGSDNGCGTVFRGESFSVFVKDRNSN